MSFISDIKDKAIRAIAKSFLLKWVDGYKTQIFRVVQIINAALLFALLNCSLIPGTILIGGLQACAVANLLNAKWIALSTILGQFGLEFGIADQKAKAKLGK